MTKLSSLNVCSNSSPTEEEKKKTGINISFMSTAMAATTISTHTFLCSSSTQRKSTHFTFSSSALLCPQTPKSRLSSLVPQLGLGLFSPWNGLKHLGISIKQKYVNIERRGRCKGKVVYASLFGVGAPEALVIGVVALLVFGPKGLAEVARNLGKTLRSFQPTIRELQEVSKEFKNTLEREIGLDDIPSSGQNTSISSTTATSSSPDNEKSQATLDPNGTSPKATPYTSEEYLKITEEQLKTYDAQQKAPHQEEQSEGQPPLQDDAPPTTKPPNIGEFLVEAQRKSMAPQQQEQSVPQEAQSQPQSQPQEVAEEQSQSQPQPQGPQTTVSEVAPTTPQPMHESEI